MNQGHLGGADAFLVIHERRQALCDSDSFAGIVFQAGALGHLVYLGAAYSGVGVTGVGGFDSEHWRNIADCPKDDDVVYLLALGGKETRSQSPKRDRMEEAYAHGG